MSVALSHAAYESCALCPRRCGARRLAGMPGRCGMSAELRVARSALHLWEEPPISGEAGSGAIFFSGCPLRCVFCQNHEISSEGFGLPVTAARLAEMMLELQGQGALNINLVTPLHFAPTVREAVLLARDAGLSLPIVCNTSGYERAEVVRSLADVVDVWLTDFKYASPALAGEFSGAPDYPEVASEALLATDATAVFASSDNIALGLLKCLYERGLRVPRDYSMVSYDNSAADVLFEPALTSIEQNVEELASAALDVLFRRIEEGERGELGEPEERILMPRLVIKDSVLAR